MGNVYVLNHPLIQHKLTYIRKTETGTKEFRELVDEVAGLMAYEITRDLPLEPVEIDTPVTKTTSYVIAGKKIGIVPILRAGLDGRRCSSSRTNRKSWPRWIVS